MNRTECNERRIALLADEKAHRRARDVAARRRSLPWVRIGAEYEFDTADGP